nr:immunoglobulin light chain junction region [Mus musculus]NSM02929.1 immunoglobulin light chain junction region [Mus musculus]
CLQHWNYPLTF